ncbi:origin recognition complex subunit 4 [Coprinopsis sp. MPI-PUGE-AT-0042]|nr:origin recognition complex subunit 4 [Coprinopsis sp. MPI-PUGE-AT-0042]
MPKRKAEALEEPATTETRKTRSSSRNSNQNKAPSTSRTVRKLPAGERKTATRNGSGAATKGKGKGPAVDPQGDVSAPKSPTKPAIKRTYGKAGNHVVVDVESSSSKENRGAQGIKQDVDNNGGSSEDELTIHSRTKPLRRAAATAEEAIVAPKRRARPATKRPVEQSQASDDEGEVAALLVAAAQPTEKAVGKRKAAPKAVQPTRPSRKPKAGADGEFSSDHASQNATRSARSPAKPKVAAQKPATRKRKARDAPEEPSPPASSRNSLFDESESQAQQDSEVEPEAAGPSKRRRTAAAVSDALPRTPSRRKRNVARSDDVSGDKHLQIDGRRSPDEQLEISSPSKRARRVPDPTPKTPSRRKHTTFPSTTQRSKGEEDDLPSPSAAHADIDDSIFLSPTKRGTRSVPASPTKNKVPILPAHLVPCLNAQKRAVLRALQKPPVIPAEADEPELDNEVAYQQLKGLLDGTVKRNEGNSCLMLGPRGSGKTRVVERCLSELETKPIIIRLSGWVQGNDRLALRQIAVQLAEQTGNAYLSDMPTEDDHEDEDANPFLDDPDSQPGTGGGVSLPPSSHLPALIAMLPTLSRSTVVIVDAFDLFALHPRQALLYCLLDTVQSCQSGKGNKGLAVIGLTTRVDTVQLLEKRVKSRFSGRILRTSSARKEYQWMRILKSLYLTEITQASGLDEEDVVEWNELWKGNLDKFVADRNVIQIMNDSTCIVGDMRMVIRMLIPPIVHLSDVAPFPTSKHLAAAAESQRSRPPYPFLSDLSYPALCLLIASHRSNVSGHPVFTFEMLYETFKRQLKLSSAAPIQLNGTSIGMVKVSREIMMSAFESLCTARLFVCAAAPSGTTAKEFVKHRCVVEREDLKKAVDKTGQINLKKWWSKAQ